MITDTLLGFNRILSFRWLTRLIARTYNRIKGYPAKRRQIRYRRNYRAATKAWAPSRIHEVFDAIEAAMWRDHDFLAGVHAAIKTGLDPQIEFFDWQAETKMTRRQKLISWCESRPEWVKFLGIVYGLIIGVTVGAVGVMFGLYYLLHAFEYLVNLMSHVG